MLGLRFAGCLYCIWASPSWPSIDWNSQINVPESGSCSHGQVLCTRVRSLLASCHVPYGHRFRRDGICRFLCEAHFHPNQQNHRRIRLRRCQTRSVISLTVTSNC
ncbi:hypothetical protein NE237_007797 [Protea cynaroides]|uniref:Secreted protein n=1 Tax=Protea cynaroides TaxID=273540 RepID=A0A9Q0QWI8_9MAGN|nr:hypothetical protein NE237_007797 [Protea cynaroides]